MCAMITSSSTWNNDKKNNLHKNTSASLSYSRSRSHSPRPALAHRSICDNLCVHFENDVEKKIYLNRIRCVCYTLLNNMSFKNWIFFLALESTAGQKCFKIKTLTCETKNSTISVCHRLAMGRCDIPAECVICERCQEQPWNYCKCTFDSCCYWWASQQAEWVRDLRNQRGSFGCCFPMNMLFFTTLIALFWVVKQKYSHRKHCRMFLCALCPLVLLFWWMCQSNGFYFSIFQYRRFCCAFRISSYRIQFIWYRRIHGKSNIELFHVTLKCSIFMKYENFLQIL